MRIDPRVQDEILTEMFLERDKLIAKRRHGDEGTDIKMWLSGVINGMSHAMGILSAWNEPNHGKVRADVYRCDTKEAGHGEA